MSQPTAIGIDFGGTTIKPAVVCGEKIVERGLILDTVKLGSADAILDAVMDEIARLRSLHPQIVAVGAGLPGLVDAVNGIVHRLSNVPGWTAVPLRQILHERSGLPCAIDNDAKAMTYAEWSFGAARGKNNVVCITLGTGVGGGLILDGKLFRGSFNGAGEVGQMSIDLNGVAGQYGNLGALEKYVGNRQIAERGMLRYHQSGHDRPLEACTPLALQRAAEAGDAIAARLWVEIGTELGVALSNVIWLLNPDCIVLGGGVGRAGELIFEPIRTVVRERTSPVYWEHLEIVPAQLGNDAGIIGAAALGLAACK